MPGRFAVCVFCASSEAVDVRYRRVAAELGAAIADRGWALVYGGGSIGLMGEVARATLAGGGHVTGVIPHRLASREIALDEVTELVRTDTMRERKALMDERSDAFVVLPGGIGTLEELVEIVTLRQLGYHDRPIVVIDVDGFWDPLLEQFARMVTESLASAALHELFAVTDGVEGAVAALCQPNGARSTASDEATLEAVESPPGA